MRQKRAVRRYHQRCPNRTQLAAIKGEIVGGIVGEGGIDRCGIENVGAAGKPAAASALQVVAADEAGPAGDENGLHTAACAHQPVTAMSVSKSADRFDRKPRGAFLARKSAYVCRNPSRKAVFGRQPSAVSFEISRRFCGIPSGRDVSKMIRP
jgi:hypothetical protein